MSRRAARFTQSDIHRAIKAIQQSGTKMGIEIRPDGSILILPVELLVRSTSQDTDPEVETERLVF